MATELEKLENNEAILLMYLNDELATVDRAEVEQMLESDATLRREFNDLLAVDQRLNSALAQADRENPMPVSAQVAGRQIDRLIGQWITRRTLEQPVVDTPAGLRFSWWAYPLSAAAMILIAWLVWWGNQADIPQLVDQTPVVQQPDINPARSSTREQLALLESFSTSDDLRDVESSMVSLKRSSDDLQSVMLLDSGN